MNQGRPRGSGGNRKPVAFAQAAIAEGNLGRARLLLNALTPNGDGDNDFRGFEWRYLMRQARGLHEKALAVSDTPIWHSALSPNGSELIVKCPKVASMKIIDLASGTLRDTTIDEFRLAAYCADGESLIVWEVGRQEELELIDRDTMTTTLKVRHIVGPPSPDGRWVVTRPPGSPTTVFDLVERKRAGTLPLDDPFIQILEPDDWIMVGDGVCCKWHTKGLKFISLKDKEKTISWPERVTGAWGYNPPTKHLIVGKDTGEVIVFDLTSGEELFGHTLIHRKADAVNAIAITRDGKTAAVTTWEAVVGLIDLESGELRYLGAAPQDDGWETVMALRKHESGEMRYVRPIDFDTGGLPRSGPRLESESFTLAFTPDGGTLVTGNKDGHVRLWNVDPSRSSSKRPTIRCPKGSQMAQLPFSRDGVLFALSSAGETTEEKEIRRLQDQERAAAGHIQHRRDSGRVRRGRPLGRGHRLPPHQLLESRVSYVRVQR